MATPRRHQLNCCGSSHLRNEFITDHQIHAIKSMVFYIIMDSVSNELKFKKQEFKK